MDARKEMKINKNLQNITTAQGTKRKQMLQNQLGSARYNLATAGPTDYRDSALRNSLASPIMRTSLNQNLPPLLITEMTNL